MEKEHIRKKRLRKEVQDEKKRKWMNKNIISVLFFYIHIIY